MIHYARESYNDPFWPYIHFYHSFKIMAYISLKNSFTISIVTEIQAPGSWNRRTNAKELWLLMGVTSFLTPWIKGNSIIHSLLYTYLHISSLILGTMFSVRDPGGWIFLLNLKEATSFVGVWLVSLCEKGKKGKIPAVTKGKTDNIMPLNVKKNWEGKRSTLLCRPLYFI